MRRNTLCPFSAGEYFIRYSIWLIVSQMKTDVEFLIPLKTVHLTSISLAATAKLHLHSATVITWFGNCFLLNHLFQILRRISCILSFSQPTSTFWCNFLKGPCGVSKNDPILPPKLSFLSNIAFFDTTEMINIGEEKRWKKSYFPLILRKISRPKNLLSLRFWSCKNWDIGETIYVNLQPCQFHWNRSTIITIQSLTLKKKRFEILKDIENINL